MTLKKIWTIGVRWAPAGAAALLCLTLAWLRYPGMTNTDSLLQYQQVTSGHLNDWQPPIMAWVWMAANRVVSGPGLMFLLQFGLYWLGFGTLATTMSRRGHVGAAWALIGLALLPSNLLATYELTKDVELAACFLLAFAIAHAAGGTSGPSRWARGGALLVLVLYGTLVRTNATFAAAPLIFYLWTPGLAKRPASLIAGSLVVAALLVPMSSIVNNDIIGARQTHAIRSLQLFDLAGIAIRTGDASAFPHPEEAAAQIPRCYTPVLWDSLESRQCSLLPDKERSYTQLWIRAIRAHPLAYAEHRADYFAHAVNSRFLRHQAVDEKYNWNYFLNTPPTTRKDKALNLAVSTSLSSPIFILIVGLIAIALSYPIASRDKDARIAYFMAMSGILYYGCYAVIGVASEFRYFFWPMLAEPVALIFAMIARRDLFDPFARRGALVLLLLLGAAIAVQGEILLWQRSIPHDGLRDLRTGLPVGST